VAAVVVVAAASVAVAAAAVVAAAVDASELLIGPTPALQQAPSLLGLGLGRCRSDARAS
jgi:hypothetical protein